MATGVVIDGSGFEFVAGGQRVGSRRLLSESDAALLTDLGTRYVRAVRSRASEDVFLTLGRELWSWLDGAERQLAALLERVSAPVTFEVRGPKTPSEREWALLRAPFELLARPDGGFLAADAVERFGVVRRLGVPAAPVAPDGFRLGLAFMASSPRRQHELDFEAEEAAILEAVDAARVDLVVEDTGNPVELCRRLAELGGMPVVHLSCHGVNDYAEQPGQPGEPVLMMEDEVGDDRPATAGELVRQMTMVPRLLFISACLTDRAAGQPEATLAHSMSTALVAAGFPAVLGWDGSVGDRAATMFAEEFYRQLSNRADLAVAVGDARRTLLNSDDRGIRADWHLARLWLGPAGGGALVSGENRRSRVSAVHGTKVFLDRKQHVPVAAPAMFVGRRPELQRALRVLRGQGKSGVLLHGQGRLGKSSLAARIADRCPQLAPAVVFGEYSAAAILEAVDAAVRTNPEARDLIGRRRSEVRDRPEALETLLIDLLSGPCAQAKDGRRPLLLIIDDLEQVLSPAQVGLHRVEPDVAAVLAGVLRAFDPEFTDSRLLMTSRFQFTLDGLEARLEQVPLRPLSPVAQRKLLSRQQQQTQATAHHRQERDALAERAMTVSRGNPGLQDLIGLRLVYSDQVDVERAEDAVAGMEAYLQQGQLPSEGELREFLENLALDTLIEQAGPEHRALLRDLTLFDLPVPEPVTAVLAARAGGSTARLLGLGLLDVFPDAYDPQRPAVAANALAVGRLEPLDAAEIADLARLTVEPLHTAWGGDERSHRGTGLDPQLTRLALHADAPQIIVDCAAPGVNELLSGPAVNAFQLGQQAIALLDRHQVPVPLFLLRRVATAATISGDGDAAGQLYGRAVQQTLSEGPDQCSSLDRARVTTEHAQFLFNCGRSREAEQLLRSAYELFELADSESEATSCLGTIADILYQRGDYDEALRILREQALPVFERLGDSGGAAVTWGQIADILLRRGDYDEALRIHREKALPVYERLGDSRSVAITWGQIADILFRRGDYDEVLRIRRDVELPVYERLNYFRAVAITWGQIADILFQRGDYDEALRIRRERTLPVYERLGDTRSIAVAWGKIADILNQRGDLDEALRIRRDVELPVYEGLGDSRSIAVTWGKISDFHYRRGDYLEALRIRRDVTLPVYERLGDAREIAIVWGKIADILCQQGDYDEAAVLQTKRLRASEKLGDPDVIAATHWGLARIDMAREAYGDALPRLVESFRILRHLQRPDGLAPVGKDLGQVLLAAGEKDQAREVLELALSAAGKIGAEDLILAIRQLLAEIR